MRHFSIVCALAHSSRTGSPPLPSPLHLHLLTHLPSRMRVPALFAAVVTLAVVRADFIYIIQYAGNECSGSASFSSLYDGCIDLAANATAPPAFGKIVCDANSRTTGKWSIFKDASCTVPADTPTLPLSTGVPLPIGDCVKTTGKTPAASVTCQAGTYESPSTLEGTATLEIFQDPDWCLENPPGNRVPIRRIVTSNTSPLDECGFSGISDAPYEKVMCSKDGLVTKTVRFLACRLFFFFTRHLFLLPLSLPTRENVCLTTHSPPISHTRAVYSLRLHWNAHHHQDVPCCF